MNRTSWNWVAFFLLLFGTSATILTFFIGSWTFLVIGAVAMLIAALNEPPVSIENRVPNAPYKPCEHDMQSVIAARCPKCGHVELMGED